MNVFDIVMIMIHKTQKLFCAKVFFEEVATGESSTIEGIKVRQIILKFRIANSSIICEKLV